MNYKVCTKCKVNLPATNEFFHVQKRGLYNLKSNCKKCTTKYNKSKWITVPKKTEKTCSHCKETFPLTDEYFYTKTTKVGTIVKKGCPPISKDSVSFRSVCKKCNSKQTTIREKRKLMIKYIDNPFVRKTKYDYPKGLTSRERQRICRIKNKGYDPETYDVEWKKQWLEKTKANRKYNYPDGYDIVPKSLIHKAVSENMTNAFIANRLGFKLEDVPVDVLELKRKQLKFYRDVKNKKNQNTNNC